MTRANVQDRNPRSRDAYGIPRIPSSATSPPSAYAAPHPETGRIASNTQGFNPDLGTDDEDPTYAIVHDVETGSTQRRGRGSRTGRPAGWRAPVLHEVRGPVPNLEGTSGKGKSQPGGEVEEEEVADKASISTVHWAREAYEDETQRLKLSKQGKKGEETWDYRYVALDGGFIDTMNMLLRIRVGKDCQQYAVTLEIDFGPTKKKTRGTNSLTNPWESNWGYHSQTGILWINPWTSDLRRAHLKIISERAAAILVCTDDVPQATLAEIQRGAQASHYFDHRWKNFERQTNCDGVITNHPRRDDDYTGIYVMLFNRGKRSSSEREQKRADWRGKEKADGRYDDLVDEDDQL